jgi:hypothetical protein
MDVREAIRHADALLPGEPSPPDEIDPRWQAILQVAHSIEAEPDVIWTFVERWGRHPQEDLRDAIATVLLEHLLEYHFDWIFPRVRELASTDALFSDTFRRCYKFGQAEHPKNARRFDDLMADCEIRRIR